MSLTDAHHVIRGAAPFLVAIGRIADIDRHGCLKAPQRMTHLRHSGAFVDAKKPMARPSVPTVFV
jgi:hypothetical protein